MTKKVKLHHRVKKFYHRNPFRKFYTLIIFWLVLANLFWLIFAGNVRTNTVYEDNAWWWWYDRAYNWYDSWNPRSERQWPCEDWWHVPSRWEWQDIVIARCNQPGNSCDPSTDLSNRDSYWNLNYISESWLWTAFRNSFWMSDNDYWSSSPKRGDDSYAWVLYGNDYEISRGDFFRAYSSYHVRCLKNSIWEVSDTSALDLTTNSDLDYELIYSGKKYTIAWSDLEGTYYWWVNENTDIVSWDSLGHWAWYGAWYTEACISWDEWNTATLGTNADWDYELTYDGTTYTIESWDLNWTYQRWINTPYVSHQWAEHNNDWWWSWDIASNWYDSWNPRSERQWPCEDWWHVPSRWEWQDIAIARCNQPGNSCDPSTDLSNRDSNWNLNYISKNWLWAEFRTSFWMSSYYYWSSSPYPNSDTNALRLVVYDNDIHPNSNTARSDNSHVRCLKNSIWEVSDTSALDLTRNNAWDYELTYNGKKYTIAWNDLEWTYQRWGNESLKDWIENNNVWWWWNDKVENDYDAWNPSSERQWPCGEWYHVPSRWERHSIANAWCHLSSNECTSCDLKLAERSESYKLTYIHSDSYSLWDAFRTNFWMSASAYWSSSPNHNEDYYAWYLYVYYDINSNSNTARSDNYHVRCIKDTVEDEWNWGWEEPETDALIIPTTENYEVHVWWNTYEDKLPSSMTVTTNNVQYVENETVLWEVSVNFWWNSNATFTELMQIKIPVEWATRAVVKVKHAWSEEYNYDWLTTNRNTSCSNWRPTSNQYNWTPISVVNWYVSIYTCEASSFIAIWEWEISAQINLSVIKWTLTIWTETWNLNLWEVNVSNNAQTLSWSFGANSFWVEDMKWVESGYYTTISVTDLTWTVAGHMISADNVSLKTAWNEPSNISWATASEAKVIFWAWITTWHSGSWQVNYFQRLNTASEDAWRVWKWWDNLQIKVNIPAHTPFDTYRWTITYTLYDMDM